MKATRVLKYGISPWLLLVVSLAGCARAPAPAEAPPAKEAGEVKRVIEVEVDGLTCHYLCQSFWTADAFSTHLVDQARFKTDFQQDFEQGLTQSDVPVSTSNYSFSFDPATRSTSTRCDVHSAIWKEDSGHRASFFWLLTPLGLDFIDDNFTESESGLSWEGSINDIPATVTVKLPTIDSTVYKAWAEPIGHCHDHAWWPTGG